VSLQAVATQSALLSIIPASLISLQVQVLLLPALTYSRISIKNKFQKTVYTYRV
jgi:hypothetical protein